MLRLRYENHSFSFEGRNCAIVVHPVLFINGCHLRAKQILDVQFSLLSVVYGEIHARHEPVRELHRKRVRHHAWSRWSIDILLYGKDEVNYTFMTVVRLPVVLGFILRAWPRSAITMPVLTDPNSLAVSLPELRFLGPMQSNCQITGVKAWLN